MEEPSPKHAVLDFQSIYSSRMLKCLVHFPHDAVDVLSYFSSAAHALENELSEQLTVFGQFKLALVIKLNMVKTNPVTGEHKQDYFYFRSHTNPVLSEDALHSSVSVMLDTIIKKVSYDVSSPLTVCQLVISLMVYPLIYLCHAG